MVQLCPQTAVHTPERDTGARCNDAPPPSQDNPPPDRGARVQGMPVITEADGMRFFDSERSATPQ
jgi:hypothetical protein